MGVNACQRKWIYKSAHLKKTSTKCAEVYADTLSTETEARCSRAEGNKVFTKRLAIVWVLAHLALASYTSFRFVSALDEEELEALREWIAYLAHTGKLARME